VVQDIPEIITDPASLERLAVYKVKSLTGARGELVLPCIPSLGDRYIKQIDALLVALGQDFTPQESNSLHEIITQRLQEGFAASPYSRLVFRYDPPNPMQGLTSGLKIQVRAIVPTTEAKYEGWVQNRSGPLFGSYPDAKVMSIAAELSDRTAPILDIGSGPGRNTLPLAKLGHPVDALELAPIFVDQLRTLSDRLPINVTLGDVLSADTPIRSSYYQMSIAAEVISHFRNLDQVRLLLTRMAESLRPGGILLVSSFIAVQGYEPDTIIRQLSQVAWSFIITPQELFTVTENLPLELVSNEPAFEYERHNLPAEAWPPTKWFTSWATGRDLFPTDRQPPMSLRWLLFRKL